VIEFWRTTGNTFRGTVFGALATKEMQSNNLTDELKGAWTADGRAGFRRLGRDAGLRRAD
jgi:hypothetical protein